MTNTLYPILLILLPIIAGSSAFIIKNEKCLTLLFTAATLLTFLGSGITLLYFISFGAACGVTVKPLVESSFIGVDLPAAGLLTITSLLFFFVSIYLPGYLKSDNISSDHHPKASLSLLVGCLLIFLGTMNLVLVSRNFGLLWVAVEATTLASAPLISYHRSTGSLEAMWKYLLICSAGIGFALLGTMCLSIASASSASMTITDLSIDNPPQKLNTTWFKIAFVFILAGFGTKMGLAPFHTWLPDAHSESPAAVSALLSGTLLNCAFLGIFRTIQIAPADLQEFCRNLLIFFGLFSILISALFIIKQADFKRMLAYSSVEHMGIIALATGLGCYGAVAIHVAGHTFLKGMLFMVAGNTLAAFGTRQISRISDLFNLTPRNAILWMAGLLLICGTPPSPLFFSELMIVISAIMSGNIFIAVTLIVLLFAVFAGMSHAIFKMLFKGKTENLPSADECIVTERNVAAPVLSLLTAVIIVNIFVFIKFIH